MSFSSQKQKCIHFPLQYLTLYDILQIYENERDYGVYCENSIVPMITSASNILFVEYKADTFHVDPGSGFNAEYNLREGKIFTKPLKRHL